MSDRLDRWLRPGVSADEAALRELKRELNRRVPDEPGSAWYDSFHMSEGPRYCGTALTAAELSLVTALTGRARGYWYEVPRPRNTSQRQHWLLPELVGTLSVWSKHREGGHIASLASKLLKDMRGSRWLVADPVQSRWYDCVVLDGMEFFSRNLGMHSRQQFFELLCRLSGEEP